MKQQAQTQLSGKVENIAHVLNEINKTDSKYDDIQRKIQREMLEYSKLQRDLDSLTEKIEEYRKMKGMWYGLSKITIITYKYVSIVAEIISMIL